MILYEIKKDEMAAALCMSLYTFYRRLRNPDTFNCRRVEKGGKETTHHS